MNNCTLLNCSINDILDYSSISQGTFKVNPEHFQLNSLI